MKLTDTFLFFIFISHLTLAGDGAGEIRKKNKLKSEGTNAFQKKEYKKAIEKFSYLLDTLKTEDEQVRMNLATATLLNGDSAGALLQYQKVLASKDKKLRSRALQQSTVLAFHQKQYKDALELSKEALKQDPSNKDARYNYEMLKKILKENPQNQDNKNQDKKDNDQKNKDQQNQQNKQNQQDKNEQQNKQGQDEKKENQQNEKQDGKNKEEEKNSKEQQEKKDKEKEKSKEGKEEKKDDKSAKKDSSNAFQPNQTKPLKPLKISPEKARMILEALRSSEKQYLQQLQKKPEKSRKKEGPDW